MYPLLLSLFDFGEISYRDVNGLEIVENSYEDICQTTHSDSEDSQRVLVNPCDKASEHLVFSQRIAPQLSRSIVIPSSLIKQLLTCSRVREGLKGEKFLGTS